MNYEQQPVASPVVAHPSCCLGKAGTNSTDQVRGQSAFGAKETEEP